MPAGIAGSVRDCARAGFGTLMKTKRAYDAAGRTSPTRMILSAGCTKNPCRSRKTYVKYPLSGGPLEAGRAGARNAPQQVFEAHYVNSESPFLDADPSGSRPPALGSCARKPTY